MSKKIKKYASFLKRLHKASPRSRKSILDNCCSAEFISCICECAKNVLKGNVPLTKTQKQQLRRRRRYMRKLVLKKTSLKNKRKIIQTGGFIGALLGPIISILGGLFGQ